MTISFVPKLSIRPFGGGVAYQDMIVFASNYKEYQLNRQIIKKKQLFHNVMVWAKGYDNYVICDPMKKINTMQAKGRVLR